MPVRGYTDKIRLPRLGKIRLGEKAKSQQGKEYPKALDYFNLKDAPAVAELFGDKPTELSPVLLPINPVPHGDGWNFDSCWKTARKAYGSVSGLFCSCDERELWDEGALFRARRQHMGVDEKTKKARDPAGARFIKEKGLELNPGEYFEMPCTAEECPYWQKKRCRAVGTLDFLLPKVKGFGTWCIQTSGWFSHNNIESFLQMLAHTLQGQITGIPLVLKLTPQEAHPEGRRKVVRVLQLDCLLNLEDVAHLRQRALKQGTVAALLPEADTPMPDDLMPHAGEALDAELLKAPEPPSGDEAEAALDAATEGNDKPGFFEDGERPFDEPPHPAEAPEAEDRTEQLQEAAAKGAENARRRTGKPDPRLNDKPRPKPPKDQATASFLDSF